MSMLLPLHGSKSSSGAALVFGGDFLGSLKQSTVQVECEADRRKSFCYWFVGSIATGIYSIYLLIGTTHIRYL